MYEALAYLSMLSFQKLIQPGLYAFLWFTVLQCVEMFCFLLMEVFQKTDFWILTKQQNERKTVSDPQANQN